MTLFSVTGGAIVACALILLLRQSKPELALLLAAASAAVVIAAGLTAGRPLFERMSELSDQAGIKPEYLSVSLKAVGICFITETGSELCRDSGQASLASKVEMFGKLTVLAAAMPVLLSLFELAAEIIQ